MRNQFFEDDIISQYNKFEAREALGIQMVGQKNLRKEDQQIASSQQINLDAKQDQI